MPAGGGRPGSWRGVRQGGQGFAHRRPEVSIGQSRHLRSGADEAGAGTQERPDLPGDGSQPAPNPVAGRRAPDPAADGVGDPRRFGGVAGQPRYRDRASPHPLARAVEGDKGRAVSDAPDQADRRTRPLRRRALRIARPARVELRWRKPCRLARLRLLGWKVRFTHCLRGTARTTETHAPGVRVDGPSSPGNTVPEMGRSTLVPPRFADATVLRPSGARPPGNGAAHFPGSRSTVRHGFVSRLENDLASPVFHTCGRCCGRQEGGGGVRAGDG